MFCLQEPDSPHTDPLRCNDQDPLSGGLSESSDDEPTAKRMKTSFTNSLNLKVYQIPSYNAPKSLSIFPSSTSTLPKFVNNPLNLANPLALATNNLQNNIQNSNSIVKSLQNRYSLPSKLTITPVQSPKPQATIGNSGEVIRYKKNGEIAKKRGPPKGYKRKPKVDLSQSLTNGALIQAQNTILTSLLASNLNLANVGANLNLAGVGANLNFSGIQTKLNFANFGANLKLSDLGASFGALGAAANIPVLPQQLTVVPQIKVPAGVELVELSLDPEDWFPAEPYKMVFSRKKNPKWKSFPYRCEHCFKGYRVASTLLTHAAERHGSIPKELAIPCPCCPHVSTRRKLHKKHLESHEGRRHRIFCLYCLPPRDKDEAYVKESEKYSFDKFPQYWYASEESLRLHKKRKHPYAAMFNYNWFCTWGEAMPNS